jgi:hypothetical protein
VSHGDPAASARWELLVEGYRRALERLTATADARDKPEDRFIPLFETLNWVVAIMDHPEGQHLYKDEIVRGLRFARNRVHHDLADALEPRDVPFASVQVTLASTGSRLSAPPTVLDWFWKWPDQLPEGRPDAEGEEAYRKRLAGESVGDALAHLSLLL